MTTSNNHTDLQHQTNQYHETTQSEGTTTVFPQATTEIRKSFKVNTQEDPTSTRLPAHDFQEETDPTSVSISKEVASYWPPAASKTKRDHDQRIPKEGKSKAVRNCFRYLVNIMIKIKIFCSRIFKNPRPLIKY